MLPNDGPAKTQFRVKEEERIKETKERARERDVLDDKRWRSFNEDQKKKKTNRKNQKLSHLKERESTKRERPQQKFR